MRIKKEERHKVTKAQSGKGKEKYSVPMCLSASVPIKRGFTLIELMAVIAIIMILATIMITNIAKHVERGREAKATADIDVLVKAVSLFQVDNGTLPKQLGDLWTPGPSGQGPYISSEEKFLTDNPWHGKYDIDTESTSYTITAYGKDGETVKVSKKITFR